MYANVGAEHRRDAVMVSSSVRSKRRMTNAFWEMLDTVLGATSTATGEKKSLTADAVADAINKSAEWSGGQLTGFDVERELRGNFAQYSIWAVSNYGDHWEFIKR
jgi:hypothetical protein